MDHSRRPYPFFVYGTLRPGHGNYARLLKGRTAQELPAVVEGHHLYARGVPYAVPAAAPHDAPPLVGALVEMAPDRYDEVLADLDALEGYDPQNPAGSHYRRVKTGVTAQAPAENGGTHSTLHQAWIYIAGERFDPHTATLLNSGTGNAPTSSSPRSAGAAGPDRPPAWFCPIVRPFSIR